MNRRPVRWLKGAVGVLGALMLSGCALPSVSAPSRSPASAPSVAPTLPPRPFELRLDGVEPCALVTSAQKDQLVMSVGSPVEQKYGFNLGRACIWSVIGNLGDTSEGYTAGAVMNHGAETEVGKEPLRSIDGFAAVPVTPLGFKPNYNCGVMVDVAPGQTLLVEYSDDNTSDPTTTRKMSCDKAQHLAQEMMDNLIAQRGR